MSRGPMKPVAPITRIAMRVSLPRGPRSLTRRWRGDAGSWPAPAGLSRGARHWAWAALMKLVRDRRAGLPALRWGLRLLATVEDTAAIRALLAQSRVPTELAERAARRVPGPRHTGAIGA